MSQSPEPSSPNINATVMASAGTGKTWLLVSRLLRLLLHGAQADSILAITFTRKAAAEMQTRLLERLYTLASADDDQLHELLRELSIQQADSEIINRARNLYEALLQSGKQVRTTTFHAFCQDILRRFPLEADVPPGFELIESSGEIIREAWDMLSEQLTTTPDSELGKAMEQLLDNIGSAHSLHQALNAFLEHRSDWWAYTEAQPDPQGYALQNLKQQLQLDPTQPPLERLFTTILDELLAEYCELLRLHSTKGNLQRLEQLSVAREPNSALSKRFEPLRTALLTQNNEPRACKASASQAKSMGEAGQQRFIELHSQLSQKVIDTLAQLAAELTYMSNKCWYQLGSQLLMHFQHIKAERRQLDFTDLEWRAYRLLHHGENAHWVQYKLDQRIDHLLVDEFQDTNPTQWRLLQPLLQEMSAGNAERQRSIFLVGDAKQSIYRFRRAEPKLFPAAHNWLEQNLGAHSYPLHTSWRSAPAIMQCVNKVFGETGPMHGSLADFTEHQTHRLALWGSVNVLPLNHSTEEEAIEITGLRNPLQRPRLIHSDNRYQREGEQIAQTIKQLITAQTAIGEGHSARPMRHGDVMILVRSRSHVGHYEQALRLAGIPYLGAERGTLLESLEVRDIVALLELLITPFNSLSLAQVLRSPIFACSDEDLMQLARMEKSQGNWYQRLESQAGSDPTHPLHRAWQLISNWRRYAGKLPIHDLLDRIYNEANVLARYRAAYPSHLRAQCESNLTRLLELSLSIDSGRYPALGRFLSRLATLRESPDDAPDEAPAQEGESRVRIMTIHASKGLEAPVVFIADAASTPRNERPYRTLVDWPADAARPQAFVLLGKKEQRDPFSQKAVEADTKAEQRENANLLYVALTRARQHLYLTGCAPTKGKELGWYGTMKVALDPLDSCAEDEAITLESGQAPTLQPEQPEKQSLPIIDVPQALTQPMIGWQGEHEIAPSRQDGSSLHLVETHYDEDARLRGTLIHRLLELLTQNSRAERTLLLQRAAAEHGMVHSQHELQEWMKEAEQLLADPELRQVMHPSEAETLNEVTILYQQNGCTVNGVVDRLLVYPDEVWVVDYKTHRQSDEHGLNSLAQAYQGQLHYYMQGAEKLWPGKKVRGFVLFTYSRQLIEVSALN